MKRSPAFGKGNTGSVSEKARKAGLSQRESSSATAPISAAPGSSSEIGTSSGNCAAPALDSTVGNGAS